MMCRILRSDRCLGVGALLIATAVCLGAPSGARCTHPWEGPWVETQLTFDAERTEYGAQFSPDGNCLVFTGITSGPLYGIYKLERGTGVVTQLTYGSHDESPIYGYSDDELWVYYEGSGDLWRVKDDGTLNEQRSSTGHLGQPNKLSDGQVIYSHSSPMGVHIRDDDAGTNDRGLPGAGADRAQPRVSPDERYVVYHLQDTGGTPYDVFLYDLQTDQETQLTSEAEDQGFATFSADGQWLVYQSREGPGSYYQLWVMDVDGGSRYQLTSGDFDHMRPVCSPDCLSIVYTGYDGHLYRMSVPEPGAFALAALGALGLLSRRKAR